MKKARMNIFHFRFTLYKLKIFGEIVTTIFLNLKIFGEKATPINFMKICVVYQVYFWRNVNNGIFFYDFSSAKRKVILIVLTQRKFVLICLL